MRDFVVISDGSAKERKGEKKINVAGSRERTGGGKIASKRGAFSR